MVLQLITFRLNHLKRLILNPSKPIIYLILLILIGLLIKNKDNELIQSNLTSSYTTLSDKIGSIGGGTGSNSFNHNQQQQNCGLNELSSGKWFERSPRFTSINQVLFGKERSDMLECEGNDSRLIEINNWLFQSNFNQCKRLDWDQFQVVKRLLTMPEGLFIVGDSLGEQFSATFRSLLSLNVLIEGSQVIGATLPNGNGINLHKILTLHKKHPYYKQFLNSKEFSEKRLERPLVQFFRNHHLISDEEITEVLTPSQILSDTISNLDEMPVIVDQQQQEAESSSSSSSSTIQPVYRIGYPWGSDPDFISFLQGVLSSYRVLPSDYDIGTLENSNPTVLVLNSGPHWHTSHFTPIPINSPTTTPSTSNDRKNLDPDTLLDVETQESLSDPELEEEMDPILLGFTKMVSLILNQLPDSTYLHTIIRSNNPVSSSCSSSISSPLLTSTTNPTLITTGSRYNYDLFPLFDEIWRKSLLNNVGLIRTTTNSRGTISSSKRRGKIEIWNDWNMMSKRMEAKKGPEKGDCLHYCIPALYESARILMQYLIDE